MMKSILAATSLALFAGAQLANAQQNPLIPNTGGMPAACPSLDDMTRTLKLADEHEVIVRLREDAKVTNDQKCEGYIKIIEDGLQKSLLAVVSQQSSNVCRAHTQPEVKSALAATILVSFPYKSAPCSAFR